MSDLSPELNLALAVDDDDTADYLVTTQGLHGTLLTLDGMFNNVTGHTHNGAHQGGVLEFQDFQVGGNLTVVGSSDLQGAVIARQTLHAIGASTLDALLTAQSLDVTTTSHLRGTVTIDGTINSGGTLSIGQDLSVGRDMTVNRNANIVGTLTVGAITTGGGGLTVGGNLSASGVISGARVVVGGADYGHVLNTAGNGVATSFWYQRAGAGRCWDNVDFTYGVGVAANTLVQRDGSGQIQANAVYIPTASQGGKPTQVLGQTGDGYTRWWPTNAIGPPISAWYAQANMTLPALSGGGGSADATFAAVANNGGFTVSGTTITVPRTGQYSIAGGFNGNNNTGNSETMNVRLYAVGTQIDSLGVPIKVSSFFGGYFSWQGFLTAGDYIHLNFQTSFDAISGSGEILVAFIPTAQYNN